MSSSWVRQLLRKRFPGRGAVAPIRHKLVCELLEQRALMATTTWTGLGGTLAVPDYHWSLGRNWSNGVPSTDPTAPDDVLFPAIAAGARKPPAQIVNNAFVFPVNSIVDGDYYINDLRIEDDNYRIDVGTPQGMPTMPIVPGSLTINQRLLVSIPQTPGQLTGLSLIGGFSAPFGGLPSDLLIRLNNTGANQEFRNDNVGHLQITATITDSLGGGAAGIIKTGVGTGSIVLAGNNTFSGSVRVDDGILTVGSDTGLGTIAAGTSVDAGTTLGITGFATVNDSLFLTGDGIGGRGALRSVINPLSTFSGNRVGPSGGTWAGGITISGDVTLGADAFLDIDTANPGIAAITGSGNLSKVGFGVASFLVANNYSGNTLVREGALDIFDNRALSPDPILGTLPNRFSTTVFNNAELGLGDGLAINEQLNLNGQGFFVDGFGRRLGALRLLTTGGTAEWLGTITLQTATGIAAAQNGLLLLTGPLGGAVDLSKNDQGRVRIVRDNSASGLPAGYTIPFTGNTLVNNGTLEIANPLALGGVGSITVNSTSNVSTAAVGTLQVEGTYTLPNPLTLNGVGFNNTGALHVVAPVAGGASAITLSDVALGSATSVATDGGTTLTVNGSVTGVQVGPGASQTSFEKTGLGTLFLNGDNTYLGTTALRAGLTVIRSSGGLGGPGGAGTRVFNGASLRLAGAVTLADELTLSGIGTSGTGVLQSDAGFVSEVLGRVSLLGVDTTRADINVGDGGVLTFSNEVAGNADLHKLGGGELRLTGALPNTFSEDTFVDAGTLALGKTAGVTAVSGQVTVGTATGANNSAVLRLDASDQIPESVSGVTILMTVNPTGLFNLNNNQETLGALTLVGGEVTTGPAGVLHLASDVSIVGAADPSRIVGNLDLGAVDRTFSVRGLPTVTFSASADPAQFGQNVALTVTVAAPPGGPTAGGSVDFFDNGVFLGNRTVFGGVATLNTSTLSAGVHTITANYLGDANYAPQMIALPSPLEIVNAPSRQTLTSNADPAAPGGASFTLTVARTQATNIQPTGSVNFFYDDLNTTLTVEHIFFGSATLNATGVATFTDSQFFPSLPVGRYAISATYLGDQFYATNDITLTPAQVVVDAPQFRLATSTGQARVGQDVTFTFTAESLASPFPGFFADSPPPTGTVVFLSNGTPIGTATLTGAGAAGAPETVSVTTQFAAAGAPAITAQYSGDLFYEPQTVTLPAGLQTIVAATNTRQLYSSADPADSGDSINFTYVINKNQPADAPPGGTVAFFRTTGTVTAPLFNGASFGLNQDPANPNSFLVTTPSITTGGANTPASLTLPDGISTITAVYTPAAGQTIYAAGPTNFTQVVANQLALTLTSNANVSNTGQPVTFTFTAAQRQMGQPAPTGTVVFRDNGAVIGAGAVALNAAGVATVMATFATVSNHVITADFVPTAGGVYEAATVTLAPNQFVTSAPTVQLRSSNQTSVQATPPTFTFTIIPPTVAPPGVNPPAVAGTVEFFANGVSLGTRTIVAGTATLTPTPAQLPGSAAGTTYTITAVFTPTAGNTNYEPRTAALQPQQVVYDVAASIPVQPVTTINSQSALLDVPALIYGGPGAGVIKAGAGQMNIGGPNTYTGNTLVSVGVLQLTADNALPDTVLTIGAFGTFDVNGRTDAVPTIQGSGTLALGAGNTGNFTVGSSNLNQTFGGVITGGGFFTKVGTGTLTLTGSGVTGAGYTGRTSVVGGTVFVNADQGLADAYVAAGATLGGTGTVNDIVLFPGATLAPGGTANGISPLTATGPVTFADGSAFVVQAVGTNTTTGFDRLVTTGGAASTVALNNATLVFAPTFTPAVGDAFAIVSASGAVSGTFRAPNGAVLANNDTFVASGRVYRINYAANNVTLTAVAKSATQQLTSSVNPASPNQNVTFTATITPDLATDVRPTGTVDFFNGDGTPLGSGTLVAGPGNTATATSPAVSFPTAGPRTIYARYTTTNAFQAPTVTLAQSVTQVSTTTLQPLNGPSVFGDTVAFVATVPQAGATVPSGTINFFNATTGQFLGATALNPFGQAALYTSAIRAGTNTIRADYSGDSFYRASSGTAVQVVDRKALIAVGADAGPLATVRVYDPRTGAFVREFNPFTGGYRGGVKVAVGDINNDGVADIVVAAGSGAPGGHVRAFSGVDGSLLASFFTFPGYTGGVDIAVGDVNGDGFADIITGTLVGSDHVRVFSGTDGSGRTELMSFFAYSDPALKFVRSTNPVGITVGAGDVNGDGLADVVTGTVRQVGHVKAFAALSAAELYSFLPYGQGFVSGVNVAAGDVDGDGFADILTGPAVTATDVKVFSGRTGQERVAFPAFPGASVGVRVGAVDRNGDRITDILTGAAGGGPVVNIFTADGNLIDSFPSASATEPPSAAGIFVGGSANK